MNNKKEFRLLLNKEITKRQNYTSQVLMPESKVTLKTI